MRAAFWIKAFLSQHSGSEYKEFQCENQDYANFCMCLLNSSLFGGIGFVYQTVGT
ncbi:hypothetical protein SD457_10530 [Coprobacillaceae bacterium CR2/5/TPMF4]|nr:hypothetical protein SD457_10530 [Coprobacillaceae bacterium CR2/5/TPMF4]